MTIDKEKLKALAEAATPGRHYDRLESAGGGIKYECAGDDGSLVLKVDHKNNEFGFVGDRGEADEAFFLACSPADVLALLAEIERLGRFEDWFVRLDQVEQSLAASYKAERDQLKAENSRLRTDIESWRLTVEAERNINRVTGDELERLKGPGFDAELAALRKDALRYRWLRDGCGVVEYKAIAGSIGPGMLPSGDKMQAAIDAAMAKEASHD